MHSLPANDGFSAPAPVMRAWLICFFALHMWTQASCAKIARVLEAICGFQRATSLSIAIVALANLAVLGSLARADTLSISAEGDATVWSSQPNTNYGAQNVLYVGDVLGAGGEWRTFLKWPIQAQVALQGATINAVSIEIYGGAIGTSGTPVFIRKPISTWAESTITWGSKPTTGTFVIAEYLMPSPSLNKQAFTDSNNALRTWVQGVIDGTVSDWGVALESVGGGWGFQSKEEAPAKAPRLVIDYTPGSTTPGDLVAWYKMDGNGQDSSGNNRHASAVGVAATADRFGNPSAALQFNGTSGYLRVAAPLSSADPHTWACWVKLDASVNPMTAFFSLLDQARDPGTPGITPVLELRSGMLRWANWYTSDGVQITMPAATFTAGVWHHVAITSTAAGTRHLYFDGADVGSVTRSGFGFVMPNFYMGASPAYNEGWLKGSMDDVRVYSRALSASEVASLAATPLAAAPTIRPANGTVFGGAIPLEITAPGANEVWYTIDGSDPAIGGATSIQYLGVPQLLVVGTGSTFHQMGVGRAVVIDVQSKLSTDGVLNIKARGYAGPAGARVPLTEIGQVSITSLSKKSPLIPSDFFTKGTHPIWDELSVTSKLGSGCGSGPLGFLDAMPDIPGMEADSRADLTEGDFGIGYRANGRPKYLVVLEDSDVFGTEVVNGWTVADVGTITQPPALNTYRVMHVVLDNANYPGLSGSGHTPRIRIIKMHQYDETFGDRTGALRRWDDDVAISPTQLKPSRSIIVVTHGWNNPNGLAWWAGGGDPFWDSSENGDLGRLMSALNADAWSNGVTLARYNWMADAATGPVYDTTSAAAGGTRAAEAAVQHGINLGRKLVAIANGSPIRVQLVGHSAGTWVCYAAAHVLRSNPATSSSQIQITLLDGYFPSATFQATTGTLKSVLAKPAPGFSGELLIERARIDGVIDRGDSYFSADLLLSGDYTGSGTQVWLTNFLPSVPDGLITNKYSSRYCKHGGPITYYTDSISQPWVLEEDIRFGWNQSIFYGGQPAKLGQVITIGAMPTQLTYGAGPTNLTATASSGLAVAWAVKSGPGSFAGNALSVTGAGSVIVEATQDGNATYDPAIPVSRTIEALKADQSISFPAPPSATYGDGPVSLSASASSGLPITFSVQSGAGTIGGATVTPTAAGPILLRASQPGDANFNSAPAVDQTLTVVKGPQTIIFAVPSDVFFGESSVNLSASTTSGLPVSFGVVSGAGSITGNQFVPTGTGTMKVVASQSGDANYLAATSVQRTFTVKPSIYSWLAGSGIPAGARSPNADANGDGIPNLVCYGLVFDPVQPAPIANGLIPGLPAVSVVGPNVEVNFVEDSTRTDVAVVIETSADLQTWTDCSSSVVASAGDLRQRRVVLPIRAQSMVFARARVTQIFVAP